MNIRAITLGIPVTGDLAADVASAGQTLARLREDYEAKGLVVQTVRLSTPPVLSWVSRPEDLAALAVTLDAALGPAGIDYAALGPVPVEAAMANPDWVSAVGQAILNTQRVFGSVSISASDGIAPPVARSAAETIVSIGQQSESGFANLRFAVQANCPPGSPFFPTGHHDGGIASFALALEAADIAVNAFQEDSLEGARQRLIFLINHVSEDLLDIANKAVGPGLQFGGIDLSLAPFPDQQRSIGAALERLGLAGLGEPGSLAAVGLLASTLRSIDVPRCGFSGVMLPVLEDPVLAERWSTGGLTPASLMLYSAVCGTGLDTIPLPGDTSREAIAGLLLDLGTLATVLNKPLTARLLPVPGLNAGQRTSFAFEYFVNARVASLGAGPAGALAAARWIPLSPIFG